MNNKNIVAVTDLIRGLDTRSLKNPEVVANLVRAFGIMPWGPSLTGPETRFINPGVVSAIGQTPPQIAKALVYLSDFKINSFCEIGVYYGGNFLFMSEYLRRFNPSIQCLGVDPTNHISGEIREVVDVSGWMRFAAVTSEQLAGRQFDLVFIDGDHSTPWIIKDWDNLGQHAKFCMFHDLQDPLWPDVATFWETLKDTPGKERMEFLDCYPDRKTHGIGLIHPSMRKEPRREVVSE